MRVQSRVAPVRFDLPVIVGRTSKQVARRLA
jgi:hypothetical protein